MAESLPAVPGGVPGGNTKLPAGTIWAIVMVVSGNESETRLSHDAAFTGALARPISNTTPQKTTLERTKLGAIAREDIVGVFMKTAPPGYIRRRSAYTRKKRLASGSE